MGIPARSTVVAGVIPILAAVNVYTFAAVVRITTGGWPDPSSLPKLLSAWDVVATWAIVALFFLAPIALVLAGLAALLKYTQTRNASAVFFFSAALVLVIMRIEPSDILDWFFD
jgi:hypothetical protein